MINQSLVNSFDQKWMKFGIVDLHIAFPTNKQYIHILYYIRLMDVYCLDQLTVNWNARRILNIDWDKKRDSDEKRNFKAQWKFEVEEFKVLYTIK